MEHPGEVTKGWRKSLKISIPTLARVSGIDKGTISRFERGGDYRKRVFDAIVKSLGKTPQDVYVVLAGPQPAPLQPEIGLCKDHIAEYDMLETILHGKEAIWKNGIISNLKAMSFAAKLSNGDVPVSDTTGFFSPDVPILITDRVTVNRGVNNKKLRKRP